MGRNITAAIKAQAQAANARPFSLVKLSLDSGDVLLNSTDRNLFVFDQVFLGVGRLGSISVIGESTEIQGAYVRLTLTGIPSAYVSVTLSEEYSGRLVQIWLGFLGGDYGIVVNPTLCFEGFIDQMAMNLGETATISLVAEHKLVRWEMPNIRRYTNEDQQAAYPGDRGMEFVMQTVEKDILWGRTAA